VEANVAPDQAVSLSRGGQVIRLMVVWGARFLAEVLAEMLERDAGISVIGVCSDLSEAAVSNATAQADVVLVDARLPEGTAAVRRALEIAPGMRIIVSAVRETEEDIVAWAEAGVIGYIPRTTALSDLVRLVTAIHNGEQLSSGRIVTGLMRRIALSARRRPNRDAALPMPALTKRERQTAELIRSGLSDKEIARQLNISLATTKSHVHNLLGKLHAQRRSQVAEWLQDYERRPSAAMRSLLDTQRNNVEFP
jgi:two-component system, NarL family, nitrate/nitrite response regulator NarL